MDRGEKLPLTPDMCDEIDRLGLDRDWFQWVVDREGLTFGRFALAQCTKESRLFDKWYPRLMDFVAAKRSQAPLPSMDAMGPMDAATLRILEPKMRMLVESGCEIERARWAAQPRG